MCSMVFVAPRRVRVSRSYLSGVVPAIVVFMIGFAVPSVEATKRVRPLREQLESHGYPCRTPAQIEEALEGSSVVARMLAVQLLAERYGKRSVPRITEMLGDEYLPVRITAARELQKLGDDGGLEQMRRDWQTLLGTEREDDLFQKRNVARLADLMDVALALVELGDGRGYRLAERTALKGPLEGQRFGGIWVLTKFAAGNIEGGERDALDAGATLRKIAASETSELVQNRLLAAMFRLGKDVDQALVATIIQTLGTSPHASKGVRSWARALQKDLNIPSVEGNTGHD